ncbi:hypothetical protein Pd630_LPD07709 [Rhodococcus opacus PD630]|nr:hypothetical protein Pd630_LPD07709 [Rhodococcus opacus PD630]
MERGSRHRPVLTQAAGEAAGRSIPADALRRHASPFPPLLNPAHHE